MSAGTDIKTWQQRYMDSLPMTEPMARDEEVAELRAALEAAEQKLADSGRDAARYRWLREQHWSDRGLFVAKGDCIKLGSFSPSREILDDQIDAAMAAQGEQK